MIILLYITGAIAFVISIIIGFITGSFWGFVLSVTGGVASAILFFALAFILEKQENVLSILEKQEEADRKIINQEKMVCTKCNYKYAMDYTSCPHCGNKD
ncbi:hypothetical protein I5677_02045 [Mobilitalea sibirica]|uniref:Uncharacterized protein n=1 Tax=Mobilitalea sibirica TaxID=1462919 RepID=A0A8J7H0L2_9FIRM|nr:hypothetical protein [Mobilitalea sibirica]MBH1939673.1 hypothetical protein [Mobilitalea sibirica]